MFHGARFIFTLMCLLHAVVGDIKSMDAYSNIYENNTTPCPNCNDEAPEDDPGRRYLEGRTKYHIQANTEPFLISQQSRYLDIHSDCYSWMFGGNRCGHQVFQEMCEKRQKLKLMDASPRNNYCGTPSDG
ncbi:uncharacterized protein LOC110835777 [Zootermopsis nevadensis]|uniref:uncharacterized protein LOC110835777 n=1 Tax=Zootermopsis nevadensis TaxID=136037 RepID=UPI000B8E2BC6|nr:uncharacterized protein LOC110835777 [Zootermopsis nevadensis]